MRKLLFLLVCATVTLAAADQTNLRIVVTNASGKPVDNASVVVKFIAGREKSKLGKKIHTEWDMKTRQEGAVKLPPIPQGKILIQVIAKNYQTFGQTYDVDEDEKTIEIKLNPPQNKYWRH